MIVRPATSVDALAVAHVHVRAWQAGYRGLLPDAFLDGLRPEERAERYNFGDPDPKKPFTQVALTEDTIRGFVTTGPARTETDGAGHLMALYIDPDHWRHGIGRRLIVEGRAELVRRGYDYAALWVLDGNLRAEQFYARDGWTVDGPLEAQEVWGLMVNHRRYGRSLASER